MSATLFGTQIALTRGLRLRTRISWMLRQLVPLTYRRYYTQRNGDGTAEQRLITWRMWLGRMSGVTDVAVNS